MSAIGIIIAITFLIVAAITTTLLSRRSLSRSVSHTRTPGLSGPPHLTTKSLPADLQRNASQYRVLRDVAVKVVVTDAFGADSDDSVLFTRYLRRNMSAFSRMPQAWLLRLAVKSPGARRTFARQHIQSRDFTEGDIVCGIYRVEHRAPTHAEFAILPIAPGRPSASGRLTISMEVLDSEVWLVSETVQWRGVEEAVLLPLDVPLVRWMHEFASLWLLHSGAEWIVRQRGCGGRRKRE